MAKKPFAQDRWLVKKEYTRIRNISAVPAQDLAAKITKEMGAYYKEYKAVEVEEFWHRKSKRVVLAVLALEVDGNIRFVRGLNNEVSLPTGTICAERAAIVKARSDYMTIRRENFRGIAVLEVPLREDDLDVELNNPLPPCGACREWLEKIQEMSDGFCVLTYPDLTMRKVHERFLFWAAHEHSVEPAELGDWTCLVCDTKNVPFSRSCRNCTVHRFGLSYNRVPTEQRFYDVLDVLGLRNGLDVKSILPLVEAKGRDQKHSAAAISKMLKRLEGSDGKNSSSKKRPKLVSSGPNGKYVITPLGTEVLKEWKPSWNKSNRPGSHSL